MKSIGNLEAALKEDGILLDWFHSWVTRLQNVHPTTSVSNHHEFRETIAKFYFIITIIINAYNNTSKPKHIMTQNLI